MVLFENYAYVKGVAMVVKNCCFCHKSYELNVLFLAENVDKTENFIHTYVNKIKTLK